MWRSGAGAEQRSAIDHNAQFHCAPASELEQIQFLLGHASVQTTERYPGCKQRIRGAVNDHIGIEPTN